MKFKVKVFNETEPNLQNEIQKWLDAIDASHTIAINNILQSSCYHSSWSQVRVTVTIFYNQL